MSRRNRNIPTTIAGGIFKGIQTEIRLPRCVIGAMALEAGFRKSRFNLTPKQDASVLTEQAGSSRITESQRRGKTDERNQENAHGYPSSFITLSATQFPKPHEGGWHFQLYEGRITLGPQEVQESVGP